jgi:hypothetical protein
MSKQATEVLRLAYNHNNMHYVHWRLIQTSLEKYNLDDAQPAMNALDELETQILATMWQREPSLDALGGAVLTPS